jgi:hypothetical protein
MAVVSVAHKKYYSLQKQNPVKSLHYTSPKNQTAIFRFPRRELTMASILTHSLGNFRVSSSFHAAERNYLSENKPVFFQFVKKIICIFLVVVSGVLISP